jgi:uncharacterized repeat protein (TIGR01451 family)
MRRVLSNTFAILLGASLAVGCSSTHHRAGHKDHDVCRECVSGDVSQHGAHGSLSKTPLVGAGVDAKAGSGAGLGAVAPAMGSGDVAPVTLASIPSNMKTGTLAYPTGDVKTSALKLTKAVPGEVVAGKPYEYILAVTNLTAGPLDNVEVVESIPAGLTLGDKLDGATLKVADGSAKIGFGTLKAGETKLVKIPATATAPGVATNCASVTYASSLCVGPNVVSPQLQVAKTLPAEILVCNSVPMKLSVTNSGSGTARNVTLEETLAEGLTTLDGKTAFSVKVGDIAAGETKTFEVPLKLAKTGTFTTSSKLTGDDGLSAAASAQVVARQPVLEITKAGPKQNYIGVPFSYDITVTNTGDAPASGTVVTDTLPAGVVALEASDGGVISASSVVWNLGTLEKGASKALKLLVRADSPSAAKNTVGVTAACAEAKSVSAETQLVGVPAILVEVVDDPDPVRVGDQTTYTISITNQGSAPQTNIKLDAALEDQMELVNVGGASKGALNGKAISFEPVATLAPKARAVWTVTVKASDVADVRFKLQVKSDQIGRTVNEEESTNFYK